MRDRSRAEIEQKLRDIGINSSLVSRVAAGAGLRGEAARRFAQKNRNLVILTNDQQKRASSGNKTSLQGRSFIERHEEQKGVSNHLHWPGGASGVTLGPGYDMRDRSRAEIEQKLRDIDLDSSLVSRVAAGAGLRGEAAKKFAHDNKNLVNLTDGQQKRLLQVNLPRYEAIVRWGSHVHLTQNEFDALVSFVYNLGRGWPGVRAAINSGDKRKAVRIIEEQVRSKGKVLRGLVKRRHDEAMLLLEGRY
jgi:GH24 family phage-related lysozyme (muramidase)